METILLLNDETKRPTQLLEGAVTIKAPLPQPEGVAGCNCDRWGHPCPRCVEPGVQPKANLPISLAVQK
jgi:hypothetical protein